ncbi:type VII secretion-associated protein [Rhodococcus daqingensis]|uniref:Type VII secretion-associated protein n=1 Tax=Rhodococcus daqingensis TaxID=2479363 RepID=A0ABW2RVH4_9NOCA
MQFGERAFVSGIADPEFFEPYPIRFVDDDYLALGDRVFPIDEVLAGVLRHAATGTGMRTTPDLMVLTHPANWGLGRRRTLVKAGRGLGKEVVLISVAAALARSPQEQVPAGSAVLEVGFLDATASVPGADGEDCVHRPDHGSSDLRDSPDTVSEVVAVLRELCPERPPRVLVTGELPGTTGLSIVDAVEAAWDLPVVVRTIPGSAVAAGALARGLELPPRVPEAVLALAPGVRQSWWDRFGRWVPLGAAGLLVVAATAAVVVVGRGTDPPARAEVQEPASARAGRASVTVPRGWRDRGERSEVTRVELVPENGMAARILVVAQELAPGADLDAVAQTLRSRAALRPAVFGALERAEVGTRPGLVYREKPDPDSEVRWSVFVEDGLQVSVGCQISPDRWLDLASACEQAVHSTSVADG